MNKQAGIHRDALELAELLKPSWPQFSAEIARSGVPTCEVAEAPVKEKLKEIEAALVQARDEKVGLQEAVNEARAAYANTESLTTDSDEFKDAEKAVRDLGECEDRIADLTKAQVTTLKMLGRSTPRDQDRQPAGDPTDPRGGAGWNARVPARW